MSHTIPRYSPKECHNTAVAGHEIDCVAMLSHLNSLFNCSNIDRLLAAYEAHRVYSMNTLIMLNSAWCIIQANLRWNAAGET